MFGADFAQILTFWDGARGVLLGEMRDGRGNYLVGMREMPNFAL